MLFITAKGKLKQYNTENRIWQGIPGIEITKKGRMFATFYSGGIKEALDNYVMLVLSDDGKNFSEPIAVAYEKGHRCFDPCLWIDPLCRLWFTWSMIPDHGTYVAICDDPDAEELVWRDVIFVGHDVMMNKPTVLSTGEWLFPIAVWNNDVRVLGAEFDTKETEKKSFVYKSIDNGKSFEKLGGAEVAERSFDEHMVLELSDGRLAMFVRTTYGIGASYSYDGGRTWTEGQDSGLGGPNSRFFIRRLPSGRVLLVNHENTKERNNLTAYLSEDDCKTWPYKLLLDERENVSYPDGTVGPDGYIYIIYDRERGVLKQALHEAYESAREILYARITEEDIVAGRLTDSDSRLRCVVSKLGKYAGEHENPYHEPERYTAEGLADYVMKEHSADPVDALLGYYPLHYAGMSREQNRQFDDLAEAIEQNRGDKQSLLVNMITLLRSVPKGEGKKTPIVESVKHTILQHGGADITVQEIADRLNMSRYYLMHVFKKETGTTVIAYKKELKISMAKKMLVNDTAAVSEIATQCGFKNTEHFTEEFIQSEHVLPLEYRATLKRL